MVSKKLTRGAGITIPKKIRNELGWKPEMAVDLVAGNDGSIVIKPHVNHCRFCKTHENVHKYKDVCICESCFKDMKEAF